MQLFNSMIRNCEPTVDNVIRFMDGVLLATECTSENVTQNAFYSGYQCDTMINNVFSYCPDGKVFIAAINFPGRWADGSVSVWLLQSIRKRIGSYTICVDQGFPHSGYSWNILVRPMHEWSVRRWHPGIQDYLLRLSNVYTSLWQASEWGMRGLQGSFSCIKKCLHTHCSQKRLVVESIVLIHNFRSEIVGPNQIKTVLDPEYEGYINLEGYDRISQYWLRPEDFELEIDENDVELH